MPNGCPANAPLKLQEIPPGQRGKRADIARTLKIEGERILKVIPKGCLVLALMDM